MISVSNQGGSDPSAAQLICRINGIDLPVNQVSRLVLCSGPNASYAFLGQPLRNKPAFTSTANMDQTYGVAARGDGPAGYLKPFTKGTVGLLTSSKQFFPLMHGRISYSANMLGTADCVMPCLFDGRWDLDKYTVGGRMLTDGTKVWWDGSDCIYNRYGHGDRMVFNGKSYHSQGHRYGHTSSVSSDDMEDDDAYASTKSVKWTCTSIIANLRTRFVYGAGRPSMWQDFGLQDIPDDIVWPEDLGSNIKENRTPRDMNLQGMSLLQALQKVVRYAGPYDIMLVALPNGKSELRVIDFAPKKQSGLIFYDSSYASINLRSASQTANLILDGFIKESVVNCFPGGVAVIGDRPSVELMASTYGSGTGALYLSRGWTSAEENSYKLKILSNDEDRFAFDLANKCHKAVYNFYKLNPARNPFAGTKWANAPQNGALTIKAHQLTSYNESNNPAGLTPREIVVEARYTPKEIENMTEEARERRGEWFYVGRYTELQLDPSRTMIRLDALRENKSTWALSDPSEAEGEYDTAYMIPREIRIQLVAESNHQLVARLGGTGGDDDDPNNISARLATDAPKFCLNMYNQSLQYVDWLRRNISRPVGEATVPVGIRNSFPAKSSRGNELFTDFVGDGDFTNPKNRLPRHGRVNLQNNKRIEYSGQFILQGLFAGYLPGQQLAYENGYPIGDISGIIKCVVLDCNINRVTVEWGPAEFSAIYDAVSPIQGGGATTITGPTDPGPKKELPKTPTESYPENPGKTEPQKPTTSSDNYPEGNRATSPSDNVTSDNDSGANNQAIRNNPTAGGDPKKATMESGGGGNAGMGPTDDLAADIAAEEGPAQTSGKDHGDVGPNKDAAPAAAAKKGTIRTEAELAQRDADMQNFGTTGEASLENGKATKGIYSGDSLKNLDNNREVASYEEGGLRDSFRKPSGNATTKSKAGPSTMFPEKTTGLNGSQNSTAGQKLFNSTGPAPKIRTSIEDAKRKYAASLGINKDQFDANRASAAKGRNRK